MKRLLVIWRHADAGEPQTDPQRDLLRGLTRKGQRQARDTARWLRRMLPEPVVLLSSPARRARETASALGVPRIESLLAPGADPRSLLAAGMPMRGHTVVLVGHQPQLGQLIASLLLQPSPDQLPRGQEAMATASPIAAGDDGLAMPAGAEATPGGAMPMPVPDAVVPGAVALAPLALRKSAAWCLQWRPGRCAPMAVLAVYDPRFA